MSRYLTHFSAVFVAFFLSTLVFAAPPPGKGKPPKDDSGGGGKTVTLSTVKSKDWDELYVRRVLNAFAYGGLATDAQIEAWAGLKPGQAVAEILTFHAVNDKLSPPDGGDETDLHCGSLAELQDFWSSDNPGNVMKYTDRYLYAVLSTNLSLYTSNLQRTWTKAVNTRGCNPFLLKMALYITNYHASITVHKTRAGLIRDYYDNIMLGLQNGDNFIELMTISATDAALARAYGHQYSRYKDSTETFTGTDDFGREFHQLLFRIQGVTEDPVYHEDTTIEHSAWMLAGMDIDRNKDAYGSANSGDWYIGPIDFTDHLDNYYNNGEPDPRSIDNFTNHYHADLGANSCLEILHEQICGGSAGEKITALALVAAAHPESMDNVPVSFINFFADDNLDQDKIDAIRGSWSEAGYDLLVFFRSYAASKEFHSADTFKYRTAFDRNLQIHNANTLDNEEVFGRQYYDSPRNRMAVQGAEVFEPAHDVFGGQTGYQAANNRYIFKDAYAENVNNTGFLDDTSDDYTLEAGSEEFPATVFTWTKEWDAVIPVNGNGEYVVAEVAQWLWNHFIGDGGKNFDAIARAHVHALLSSERDFAYSVDSENREAVYTSEQILNDPDVSVVDQVNAAQLMDFSSSTDNRRVGMAVNFISMTPYAFAMEGQ
jgi:hypothetical protein